MNQKNLPPPIEVTDLRDPDRKLYYSAHVGPRGAVICAYAQEFCGDWNTWNYERSYAHLVKEGKYTFSCGDFAALKPGITNQNGKLVYDPQLWPEEYQLTKEQAMPAVINLDPDKRIVQPKEKPAEQPKRPRGRPRKNPTDQVITAAQVEEKVENVLPVKPAKPAPAKTPVKTPVKPVPEKSLEEQTNAKIQAASQVLAAKVNPKPEPKPEEKTPEQPPAPAPEPAPTKRRWEFELSPDDIL